MSNDNWDKIIPKCYQSKLHKESDGLMTCFCKHWDLFTEAYFPILTSLSSIIIEVEWPFWSKVPYDRVPITYQSFYFILEDV